MQGRGVMKRIDQGPDLFDWSAAQPVPAPAQVVSFLEKRETLPRWILARRSDLEHALLDFDRRVGLLPPAPILAFKLKTGEPWRGASASVTSI
jgi:hypothetical protein